METLRINPVVSGRQPRINREDTMVFQEYSIPKDVRKPHEARLMIKDSY
jgi:cytochrome P450